MLRQLCLAGSLLLIASISEARPKAACPLKDGDLIFIKSQSQQAKLLKLTTDSEWTHVGMAFKKESGWEIIEAVGPVKWTSLYTFVRRSHHMAFEVKRANFDFDAKVVKSYSEEKLGLAYDLIFAWDAERWYCTELVWKAYKTASGEELGSLETIGDLNNIDHPLIKTEAGKRFASYGMSYNHESWKQSPVITPVQMMRSGKLLAVGNQDHSEEFTPCLRSR